LPEAGQNGIITQVASYKRLRLRANAKRTTMSSKLDVVTAWIGLGRDCLSRLPAEKTYIAVGYPFAHVEW
jgi:hypothetical protein